MTEKIKAQNAKQANEGVPVLKVLIYGLALMLIIWFIAELAFDGDPAANDGMVPSVPIENSATE